MSIDNIEAGLNAPLAGITILDCTIWQNGPYATVLLSDLGADVIKVEDSRTGDPGRGLLEPDARQGVSAYFEGMNRNKRSITLDLKSDKGREVFYRLATRADVVVQNFRAGVAERLKIDYQALKEINPTLIYASATGYGRKGPHAKHGVFDILGVARSGAMNALRYPGAQQEYVGTFGLGDQTGAILLAQAITTALLARERFGIGQEVEISQLGAMMMLQHMGINRQLINGVEVVAKTREEANNALFTSYLCADGRWLAMGGLQADRYWNDFCELLELQHLREDARFADIHVRKQNVRQLIPMIDQAFSRKNRAEWLELLNNSGIPASAVNNYQDLANDVQVRANDYVVELEHPTLGTIEEVGMPIQFSATPCGPRSVAPEFGQHTEEILLEAGYDWDEIIELRENNVL